MTPEFLVELSKLPLFPRTARALVELVGVAPTAALIGAWGGAVWPVPVRVGGGNTAGRLRYAQLCEIAGDAAAERIVRHWGGTQLTVPNLKEVIWSYKKDRIRAEFDRLTTRDGYSGREATFELVLKYRVTARAVEKALGQPDNPQAPVVVQRGLF